MKPPVETIRLGQQSKDHLIKIKRITRIEHWNIICRWAFCVSLREPTPPPKTKVSTEGGVEIPWKIFSGAHDEVYCALGKMTGSQSDQILIQSHIRRGLSLLATSKEKDIGHFIRHFL